jgi:hypothetical protein
MADEGSPRSPCVSTHEKDSQQDIICSSEADHTIDARPRQGHPRTKQRKCDNQPVHQSLITDVSGAALSSARSTTTFTSQPCPQCLTKGHKRQSAPAARVASNSSQFRPSRALSCRAGNWCRVQSQTANGTCRSPVNQRQRRCPWLDA